MANGGGFLGRLAEETIPGVAPQPQRAPSPHQPAANDGAEYVNPQYWALRSEIQRRQAVIDRAKEIQYQPGLTARQRQTEAERLGAIGEAERASALFSLSSTRDVAVRDALNVFIDEQTASMRSAVEQAALVDPIATYTDFPHLLSPEYRKQLIDIGYLPDPRGGGGGGFAPAPYQFQIGPAGEVVVFNPNTGGVNITGTFPELAQKNFQVVQDPRTGDLVRFDPNTGEQQVLIPDFGFPEIDPRVQFETNVRLQEQQLAAQFAGLELERRGQMIEAFANDMATQISLGRMRYEEASLQLETIDRALNQRRQEREVALQFAVRRSSIRTVGGEQVTVLPGAAQLAALLTQATGQQFTEDFATLPTGQVDPNAAARAVAEAAQFQSPIPGLEADLATNREAINAIVGAPLGTQLVTQQAGAAVTEGI